MRWRRPSRCVALEDLGRAVDRAVVGRDDEVDAGAQMVRDLSVDDVGLVADEQGHARASSPTETREAGRRCPRATRLARPPRTERSGPRRSARRSASSGSCESVRADRAPLREAIAQSSDVRRRASKGAPTRPERVRLLRVAPERRQRTRPLDDEPVSSQAWSGWVSGEPGTSTTDGSVDRAAHRVPHVVLVSVPVEVDAPEREPARRDAENRARDSILLSTCASRLAFGEEAGASIPPARRSVRCGIQREDREKLDRRPERAQRRHRRTEREHAVVRVRREDDDPAHALSSRPWLRRTGRLGLAAGRRVVPAATSSPAPAASRGRTSSGDGGVRRASASSAVRRRSTRTGASSAARRSTASTSSASSAATPTTYADAFSRSPPPTTRADSAAASRASTSSWRRRAIREATIVGDLSDAPQIPDDVVRLRDRDADAPVHLRRARARWRRWSASSHREACFSRRCPG